MTASGIFLRGYTKREVTRLSQAWCYLYAAVYAEPPYGEGPREVRAFEERLAEQMNLPGFALVAAWSESVLLGFIYGFTLEPKSDMWGNVFLLPHEQWCASGPLAAMAYVSELLVNASWR